MRRFWTLSLNSGEGAFATSLRFVIKTQVYASFVNAFVGVIVGTSKSDNDVLFKVGDKRQRLVDIVC